MNQTQVKHRLWGLYSTLSTVPVPLKSLDIHIEIIHTVARVFYSQQYFNDTNLRLETEFFFPISPDACFDSFEATFNNTTIKGVVKEKEKAKEEYKEAVEQGRTAAYSEINQETGDIMKIQIGNIPPQTDVRIKYSYILKLETMLNKFWCFRLFSTLTPRYKSSGNNLKDVLSHDVDILSKYPTISENNSEAYPWSIQAEIQSPSPITFLKCPSHDIITTYGNEKHTCLIGLNPATRHLPNKDFVLLYTNGREKEKLDYLLTPFEDGYCAMVSMLADFDKDSGETKFTNFQQAKETENQHSMSTIRGEYIFLLDRSGSMSGARITMAKESLILFLMSIPKDSYFNVISFGSGYQFLHYPSLKYSQESLDSSIAKIETFNADLGGTEIHRPLQEIFNSPPKKGYPRFIFLLTDGDVSNTQQVLDLILTNNEKARVFTIGIGNGCSPELITKAASYGRGKEEFVTDNSEIHEKVISLLNSSLSPCYSDLSLHSDNFDAVVKSVSPNPASIPFLINGQTVTFFLLLRSEAFQDSQMGLQLRLFDSRIMKNRNLGVELDLNNAIKNELIPKLAIHDMIRRLDAQKDEANQGKADTDVVWREKAGLKQAMVEYSLKYGILCKETAFFCEVMDSEKQNINILPAKVVVPATLSNDYRLLGPGCARPQMLMSMSTNIPVNMPAYMPMQMGARGNMTMNQGLGLGNMSMPHTQSMSGIGNMSTHPMQSMPHTQSMSGVGNISTHQMQSMPTMYNQQQSAQRGPPPQMQMQSMSGVGNMSTHQMQSMQQTQSMSGVGNMSTHQMQSMPTMYNQQQSAQRGPQQQMQMQSMPGIGIGSMSTHPMQSMSATCNQQSAQRGPSLQTQMQSIPTMYNQQQSAQRGPPPQTNMQMMSMPGRSQPLGTNPPLQMQTPQVLFKAAKPPSNNDSSFSEKFCNISAPQEKSSALYLDVIRKQKFEGNWDASDQSLLHTILTNHYQFSPPQKIKDINLSLANTIWITILVLRWLELACKDDRKAWMLVYQKGCEWLKDHGVDYQEVKDMGQSILKIS